MKNLLLGINAKYIHPNLAIRLLKKNTDIDVDIKEFTIKDSNDDILKFISSYDTIAISTYIWNVNKIKEMLPLLKDKIVILGGPEVSYNAGYYLDNNLCSYVIKNEGEESYNLLLHYLNGDNSIDEVPNLYYKGGYTFDKLVDLSKAKMAYDLFDDVKNKIMYIETSRGCPYHCGYCMASLDNKVRFFDIEEIKAQIRLLQERGARVFKFLDRTYNANPKFLDLIDFIIESHKEGQSYQFEITGDLLKPKFIDYINERAPKNLIRFEIGIQSTNIKTNRSVGRIQNNDILFSNIKKIQDAGIIDLHLDLIAGLPYEDYKSFEKTFNDVVALRPKELQLGFLKLLYGTRLFKEAILYNYVWMDMAPYEVIKNDFMSEEDISNIHLAEDAFEHYYNSGVMKGAMNVVLDYEESPFDFFFRLGHYDFKHNGLEHLFRVIDDFIKPFSYYNEFHKAIILDYLNYFNLKPKAWWDEKLDKHERNIMLRELHERYNIEYPITDLYKYSLLIDLPKTTIIAIYKENDKKIIMLNK